jgi:hypothetical protein
MSTTMVTPYIGSATPWLLSPKWRSPQPAAEPTEATPLALDPAAPALREAVRQFSEAFESFHDQESVRVVCAGNFGSRTLISNVAFSGRLLVLKVGESSRVDREQPDPLIVFDRIQGELAVTQKELLAATGIRHRTYYSWRNLTMPRPRPASLGRLWHLADALVDLRETLERPVAAWIHASPERMAAFKEGRFEDLVDLAVTMPKPSQPAHGVSRRIGVAADVDMPVVKTGRPKVTAVERSTQRDGR